MNLLAGIGVYMSFRWVCESSLGICESCLVICESYLGLCESFLGICESHLGICEVQLCGEILFQPWGQVMASFNRKVVT
jgi:hypothetical protein